MSDVLELLNLPGQVARRWHQQTDQQLSALGLNHTEARLLVHLDQEGSDLSQEAVSAMLFVDRSNSVRALQSLERSGFVSRHKDENDKRANRHCITSKGTKAASEVRKLRRRVASHAFAELKPSEVRSAVALLKKALETG